MIGTWINIATVLVGGGLGLLFGARLPERARQTVFHGLGVFTLLLGVSMFTASRNPIYVLLGLLLGGMVGEALRIEDGLRGLGAWFERRLGASDPAQEGASRFVRGFLTASLLFCVGPMTILGSIQDGLLGDYRILATKALMDGFAALAFASTLGVGVLFSVVVILVYQGGLSLLAAQLQGVFTEAMLAELNGAGGVLLVALALSSLLELKRIRVGNLLPALVIAPLLPALVAWLRALGIW
ncbi:MAG: DUF554 domain-containing protein [Chloroflexi bacterium]|nr:DUF554 domain-containing protein [Chloroflexota bacterium]